MPAARLLLIEDAEAIRLPLTATLEGQGYEVLARADGDRLEADLGTFGPDLVLLDLMLPGRDGFTLLEVVRAHSTAGVLILTARDGPQDRVRGLLEGADDYLVKPFLLGELLARVTAVLRRTGAGRDGVACGDLVVSEDAARVTRGGVVLDLTSTERRLLSQLSRHLGRTLSKTQLLTAVWGYQGFDVNLVEVHISSLRRKLEAHGPRLLHTVRGRGYGLAEAP